MILKFRTPLLITFAIITGYFWTVPNIFFMIFSNLLPVLIIAFGVVLLFRDMSWNRQALLVVFFLVLAEFARDTFVCLFTNGWAQMIANGNWKTYIRMFGVQVVVGLVAWGTVKLFLKVIEHKRFKPSRR